MDENDKPEVPAARKALVQDWCKKLGEAEDYWSPVFKRMRDDMRYAKGLQWGQEKHGTDGRYTVNLTLRHIRQRVAALYAKNPRIVAQVRKRLDFQVWDGDPQSVAAAQQLMMASADPMALVDPMAAGQAAQLLQDYTEGMAERRRLQKIGVTLECLFDYFMRQGKPIFKTQLKQLIVRVLTCGVGYVKIGFQREMERSPDLEGKLRDFTERLAHMERLIEEISEGDILPEQAEVEEARLMVATMQSQYDIIIREGLVFDFPRATNIVIDPCVTQLKGFLGAGWIAQKFIFSPEQIKETYGVDLCGKYTKVDRTGFKDKRKRKTEMATVYEVQDSDTGQQFTVCLGHDDFLREPAAPDVQLSGFWTVFPLTFNDIEDEDEIFPPSDVMLIRSMQDAYNEAREGLREHREGNRPAHIAAKGVLTSEDKARLGAHATHEVIELDSVLPGTDVKTVIMAKPTATIDPNLYEVETIFADILRSTGAQEANLGGTSGATATESGIAESSRMSSIASSIDDLDDFLSQVAAASSEILLTMMSQEQVVKIVGRGAVWPQMTAKDAIGQVWLEVKAGSSGRPNKAQDISNFERIAPTIIQIPGIRPRFLAEEAIKRLDDALDLTEAFDPAVPALVAMNANKQGATGDPATDPNAQGAQGGNNDPRAERTQQGPAPSQPTSRF